jgi:hypothetical protein
VIASTGLIGATIAYGWEQFGKPWAISRAQVRYINGLNLGFSNRPEDPIIATGTVAITGPLQIFVDIVGGESVDMQPPPFPAARIKIGELTGKYKGEPIEFSVAQKNANPNVGADLQWANSKVPIATRGDHQSMMVYGRLVVIGSDGREQRVYFRFWGRDPSDRHVVILRGESPRWVERWERN